MVGRMGGKKVLSLEWKCKGVMGESGELMEEVPVIGIG